MKSILHPRVVFELFLITGFFIVGVYTVLNVYGYKYNIQTRDFEQVGIIDIGGEDFDANIFFDNVKLDKKIPFVLKDVAPGLHHIRIEKQGFFPYDVSFLVSPAVVVKIDSVVMMPQNLVFTDIKNSDFTESIFRDNQGNLSAKGDNIYVQNNEIWIRDSLLGVNKFISRFNKPVSHAMFFSDDYNILFVLEDNLNFCDQIMQNCYKLRSFSEGDQFAVEDKKIFYKDKYGKVSVLNLSYE